MNAKHKTLSIGIPARNEQPNIGHLLRVLLTQELKGVTLQEIVVVSDASTDGTQKEVLAVGDKRITLIANRTRQGQNYSQNVIFEHCNTDMVILLEADTLPLGKQYIQSLIAPLLYRSSAGLVQGNSLPIDSFTLLGRVLQAQIECYHKLSQAMPQTKSWLASGRGGRAFSKSVYNVLRWPKSVPEDVYALLWCKSRSVKIVFRAQAVCAFRCAQVLSDALSQQQKVQSGRAALTKHFPLSLVNRAYYRPGYITVVMSAHFFVSHPAYMVCYAYIKLIMWFQLIQKPFSDFFPAARTTKQIT